MSIYAEDCPERHIVQSSLALKRHISNLRHDLSANFMCPINELFQQGFKDVAIKFILTLAVI